MGTYCASTVAAAGPFEKGAAILLLAITGAGIVVAEVLLRGERSTFKDALLMAKALCMILKFYCLFVTQYSVVLQCILFLWIKDIKLVVFTDQMNPQVKRRINLVEENADARCGCWSGVLWEVAMSFMAAENFNFLSNHLGKYTSVPTVSRNKEKQE